MPAPHPENIGDIYRIWGYAGVQGWRYGVAFKGAVPGDFHSWCWWLAMDDDDEYVWPDDEEMPDMGVDRMELLWRNPLPDWIKGLEDIDAT